MDLTVGVLIIGSLYWDDGGGRDRWRALRLDDERKCLVKVPIRYGRKASTRGNTYTMVFSRLAPEKLGQAIVIRCRRRARGPEDLIAEAQWLWAAETSQVPEGDFEDPTAAATSANWGRVALLLNPRSAAGIPHQLLERWSRASGPSDDELMTADGGILDVAWPDRVGGEGAVPLDVLLATTNRPTDLDPSARIVADAWNAHGRREYFDENQRSGILIFQDDEIRSRLG